MSAAAKHHVEAPADPVDAAITKYAAEMVLPELTTSSPDDLLIAHLHRTGDSLIRHIEVKARQAYDHALSRRGVPAQTLTRHFEQAVFAIRNLKQSNRNPGRRDAGDWTCQVGVLRICLETMAFYANFADRWGKMSPDQQAREVAQAAADANARLFALTSAAVAPVGFSPATFLTTLQAREIIARPTADGMLLVMNANRLTASERITITQNKVALLGQFGSVEVF